MESSGKGEGSPFENALYMISNSFENKAHDFPNMITYELTSDDQLVATIQGILNNKPEKISFNYLKIKEPQKE